MKSVRQRRLPVIFIIRVVALIIIAVVVVSSLEDVVFWQAATERGLNAQHPRLHHVLAPHFVVELLGPSRVVGYVQLAQHWRARQCG